MLAYGDAHARYLCEQMTQDGEHARLDALRPFALPLARDARAPCPSSASRTSGIIDDREQRHEHLVEPRIDGCDRSSRHWRDSDARCRNRYIRSLLRSASASASYSVGRLIGMSFRSGRLPISSVMKRLSNALSS